MPSRLLLTVFATLNIAGGLACILAPALMLRSFGVVLPPMGIVIYQFWGIAVAGTGALLWLLRNRCGDGMPVPLVSILVVMNTLNAAIAVRGQFSGGERLRMGNGRIVRLVCTRVSCRRHWSDTAERVVSAAHHPLRSHAAEPESLDF